jgi:hypothetical protein
MVKCGVPGCQRPDMPTQHKCSRCGVNPVHGPCCQERYSLENEWVCVPDGECPSLVPGTVTPAVQDSGKSRKRSIGEALQREAAAPAATVEVKSGDFRNIVTPVSLRLPGESVCQSLGLCQTEHLSDSFLLLSHPVRRRQKITRRRR